MDREQLDALVTKNMGLVKTIAWDFAGGVVLLEDLHQEGYVGLVEAARRFDPDRGVPFGAYARWWIRLRMGEHRSQVLGQRTFRPAIHARIEAEYGTFEMDPVGVPLFVEPYPSPEGIVIARDLDARVHRILMAAIVDLPPRLGLVVMLRAGLVGEPLTHREVGEEFDLSRHQTAALNRRATALLRAALAGVGGLAEAA